MHLRDEGLQRLPNGDIFAKADAERRVILTFDLDFGELVALAKGRSVSVVVFRLRDTRTQTVIQRLGVVLRESADSLSRGAIIVVEDGRHRVRKLAIGSE